jgi:hypothetical protein
MRKAKRYRTWVDDLKIEQEKAAKAAKALEPKQPGGNPNWTPGRSGNPGGRPRGFTDLQASCRKRTPRNMRIVDRMICSPKTPPALRLDCIRFQTAYGWGRPPQEVTMIEQTQVETFSDSELLAMIAMQQRAEQAEQTDETPEDVTLQ